MVEWYEPYAALGAFISALITAVIAVFLYKQLSHLKTQTREIKQEIANRMRPWLKIDDIEALQAKLKNGKTMDWKEYVDDSETLQSQLEEVRYTFNVKNIGSLPTKKCTFKIHKTKTSEKEMKKKNE